MYFHFTNHASKFHALSSKISLKSPLDSFASVSVHLRAFKIDILKMYIRDAIVCAWTLSAPETKREKKKKLMEVVMNFPAKL